MELIQGDNMTININETQSQSIGKLLEALGKAQNQMEGAVEDSSNPYFKSKYADLTSVWRACREPLTKNGLSVIQTLQVLEGQLFLISVLGHVSGEWIKSFIPVKPSKEDIQSLGSAITYCRRYTLAALVGVCPVDDDGESAMDRSKKNKQEEIPLVKLNLPKDVVADRVEEFFKESAQKSGSSIAALKKRASENMEAFLNHFKKWDSEQSVEEIQV